MKQRFKSVVAGGVLALSLFGSVAAGPLEDGEASFPPYGECAAAMKYWRPLAEQGNARAQANLGSIYIHAYDYGCSGEVAQDYAQALAWYRRAADQGLADAQFNLGLMYADGPGVPQDYAQATAWYRKAADQGNGGAQFNLGVMYDKGLGVPQDDAQAATWYRKAAEQGYAAAQSALDAMCSNSSQATCSALKPNP
jgi:TPR repeat protein